MACWLEDKRPPEFLEEIVRLEGPGVLSPSACASCHDGLRDTVPKEGRFKCEQCWGTATECLECCLAAHQRNPFHHIQYWNNSCFEPVTLHDLGLRLQLGHRGFQRCHNPVAGHPDFTVLHTNAIHKVAVDFCGCGGRAPHRTQMLRSELYPATTRKPKTGVTFRLLEEHDMLSSSGKLSVYEHYQALEKMTDNLGINLPKRRYKSFLRVNRQFANLKLMKRAGRGSVENGYATTQPGELALPCPACPQPGVNLPPNWKSAPPDEKFLYRPIFSLDANFRLKNLRRP
ncbi:hypothetical protein BDZ89DRAFT_974558, partial [Hymenopellis radicata]